MTKIINSEIKKTQNILKALNHPLREQILADIWNNKNSINVTDLQIKLRTGAKIEQSVVSQQLSILRNAKLVTKERKGKYIFYSVDLNEISRLEFLVQQINKN